VKNSNDLLIHENMERISLCCSILLAIPNLKHTKHEM
jgi:hypothetical protein